ncbi:hypothetical protein KEJ49_02240 [Candidatus Bathyarchaeota archaeon]|nr:hypothetical protein [Candidatus Bathyarchaeota archaeon]
MHGFRLGEVNRPKGASRLRGKVFLYILIASFLGFAAISSIPSGVEYIAGGISRGESMAKLDSTERAKGMEEPLTGVPQPPVVDSSGWMTLFGLWTLGLLLSLGVYFLARGWRG